MKYLFGSRILTHGLFWLCYYLLFGFIWAKEGDYWSSYFLEFMLLPVRMAVVYATLYVLMPRFLLERKFMRFCAYYVVLMLTAAVFQRFSIYFFYEQNPVWDTVEIFDPAALIRSIVLINSTTILLLALKVLKLYFEEQDSERESEEVIEIKSEKRFYRIKPSDILYLEGLGNYVTYHLNDGNKIIGYNSLKKAQDELPETFARIHKSFVINQKKVISYNNESVEILPGKFLRVGPAYQTQE